MGTTEWVAIGLAAMNVLFALIWSLLHQRDAKQGEEIRDLYEKHSRDVDRLQALELEIAKKHYERPELDSKFDRLEQSIREGLRELSGKFDKLAEVLALHKNGGPS